MFARHVAALLLSVFIAGGLFVGAARAQSISFSRLVELFISMEIIPPDKATQARDVVRDMGLDRPIPDHSAQCPQISRGLDRGATGRDVEELQAFLAEDSGLYPEGLVTGYYGALTQQAVQRYQTRAGIVSSGDPQSTGFGRVGPKTRAALAQCVGMSNRSLQTPSTGSGPAPAPAPSPAPGGDTPPVPQDTGGSDDEGDPGDAPPPPPPPPPPSL